LRLAFALLLGVLVLVLTAIPVLAAAPVQFGGPEGTAAGEFLEPKGIAVDQASGDTYVSDSNNNRIEEFGPEGRFLLAFGWGVADDTTAALQTCTATCFPGILGEGAGQFSAPEGIAVDNSPGASHGDLYVIDRGNHRVQEFGSNGEFILMLGGGVDRGPHHPGNLCTAVFIAEGDACGAGAEEGIGPGEFNRLSRRAVAVGPGGSLFVGDIERVQRFSPAGVLEGQFALLGSGFIENLAVDSAGDIYVQSEGLPGVREYDQAGTELGKPRDEGGRPGPLAIGPADQLFVADLESPHILSYDPSGKQLSSTFETGANPTGGGLAYGETAGGLYFLHQAFVHFLVPAVPGKPYVIDQSATTIGTQTATLNATLNPEGATGTTYFFQYGTTVAYGQTSPSLPGELAAAAFEDKPVAAAISGVAPRTTYHYRVVAENAAHEVTQGPDQSFETLPPVSIDSTSVSEISSTTATLETELNPHGLPSTYRFEYDTVPYTAGESPHGTSTPEGSAGSGIADVTRTAVLQGLAPATTYHFRVVGENALGAVQGPDRTFTTQAQASPLLPDGRGWEMVSPVLKNGNTFEPNTREGGIIQAAADGSGLAYVAKGPVGEGVEGNRNLAVTQLLASRAGAGDWSTRDISTPHQRSSGLISGENSEYRQFSPDLQTALLEPAGTTPLSPDATERTPYLRTTSGAYIPLLTTANVQAGVHFGGIEQAPEAFVRSARVEAATTDLQTAIIVSAQPLTSEVQATGIESLFAWHAGRLQLASVLPDGTSAASHGLDAVVGSGGNVINALSADGSRMIFGVSGSGAHGLYVRDLSRGLTVRVDVSEAGWPAQPQGEVQFRVAAADDSRIYFTDNARLSKYAHGRGDLYLCRLEEVGAELRCDVSDVSRVLHPGESAEVQFANDLGTSTDGRYVYFVANGVLAPGAAPGNCRSTDLAEALTCNLYVADAATGQTRLIARLTDDDRLDWGGNGSFGIRSEVTSTVSPDGLYASFMSSSPLTGYDNRDAVSGERDEEVFLYSFARDELVCASCDPSGARPHGVFDTPVFPGLLVDHPFNWVKHWLAGSIPSGIRASLGDSYYVPRFLADSGRLFFNSPDQLVPQDSNGKEDVYQYEPVGVGDCSEQGSTFSSKSNGCVGLISSGTSPEESAFLDASESGNDVFFLTASSLVPRDVDKALDVYDARVGGGEPQIVKPIECSGDACQSPVQAPNDPTPGSLTFSGPGNRIAPLEPPAKKTIVKSLTRAQKLVKALKACKKLKSKTKRSGCERTARKRYGPAKKARRATNHRRAGS
jgi:hypothetical protein